MSVTTQFTTFADLYTGVLNAVRANTSQTAVVSQAKRAVNVALQAMHLGHDYQFYWAERQAQLFTAAPYTTGTLSLAQGNTSLTGSGTGWTDVVTGFGQVVDVGWKMKFPGNETVYTITAVSNPTTLTIGTLYVGDDLTASTYTAFKDTYSVASDYLRSVDMGFFDDNRSIKFLDRQQLRRMDIRNSIASRPRYATQIELGPSGSTALRPRIVLYPTPDSIYQIPYSYITNLLAVSSSGTLATAMSSDTDEPIVPLRYRHAIYYYALKMFYEHKDDARMQAADAAYREVMQRTLDDVNVGDRRARFQPKLESYVRAAHAPYSGRGRFRRWDTGNRFDRME